MAYVSPIVARAESVAAKIESVYATDPVPTAALNAVRVSKRAWNSLIADYEWPNLRDDAANNSFIPLASAFPAGLKARLSLQWELKGLGADYTSATVFVDADPLFQACGWAGTWSATPTHQWTYAPIGVSTVRPSCTIYVWSGANQYKISGCRGNFEAVFRAGQIIQVTFTLEGILQTTPLVASVPATTYTGGIPPAAIAQVMSIGPWTADYDEITVRSGNNVQWLYSGNQQFFAGAGGLQSYDFGISRPEIVVVGRSTPQSTYDPIVDWSTAAQRAFTMAWGITQFNKGTVTDSGIWIPSAPATENHKEFTGWRASYRCLAPALLFN
jgi:hypothetical protein